MELVQHGDLNARVRIENNDELGKLGKSFNSMTERIDHLLKRIIVEQEEKRRSELNALKAQIKPHFLYNTLDSIIWMAECNQTEEVVEMTSALSKMLRASIIRSQQAVTLKLELQNAENYLKIQKFRYSNKLEYEIDVPEYLYNKEVVHLVLQPLVENAIYHGIKDKPEGGKITINASESDELIYINVIDNGAGIPKEKIHTLLENENNSGSERGIGLYNVNQRIKLIYGDQCGLKIQSSEGIGTTVTIILSNQDARDKGDELFESQS
jgi:two-component system sensor histidine kinase YesM